MVDALTTRGVRHTDALRLHVDALQAQTSAVPLDRESLAAIERELVQMRAAIGAMTGP